ACQGMSGVPSCSAASWICRHHPRARGVGFVANRGRVWRGFPQSGQRSAAMIDQFRAESRRTGTESRQCGQFLSGINQNFDRSEEHTSELQSRENLVCRLLLEKKNK